MASTVLPNGIIIPEKYSRDWYNDLYHNWQELDNLLGASGPGDGTLTIQKNGTTIDTFTANSSTDKTVNISVPTKTSDLNNDSGFITGVSWNDVADKPSFATVATSGSYNDLSDKPTIPSKTSDLTNDSGFITSDNTKIPLAGSNQISGSLIPATDNAIDIGSSTKNLKMLYTKGVTIDGKTVDTDANGNMTYDGHIVDTIEEQGTGYIRYTNGIQICWGNVTWATSCASPWGAIYESDRSSSKTYAKSFINTPCVSVCNIGAVYGMIESNGGSNTIIPSFYMCRGTANNTTFDCIVSYIAIGRWK